MGNWGNLQRLGGFNQLKKNERFDVETPLQNISLVTIFKHSFEFIFVFKYKPFFKLIDEFFFLTISLINTTNLS